MKLLDSPTCDVLMEIWNERDAQDEKWGQQNHANGTGGWFLRRAAEEARTACNFATSEGRLTWRHILEEEVAEVFAESDAGKLRTELLQVAAVAAAWVEAIDRRAA